jgi:hypothetical protein
MQSPHQEEPMALRERLSIAPKGRGHYCTVGFLLVDMATHEDQADFQALEAALSSPDWPSRRIQGALLDEGITSVTYDHLKTHRKGDCTTATCAWPNTGTVTARGIPS